MFYNIHFITSPNAEMLDTKVHLYSHFYSLKFTCIFILIPNVSFITFVFQSLSRVTLLSRIKFHVNIFDEKSIF